MLNNNNNWICNNINYLYRLIKQFIDISKINSEELQFNFQAAEGTYHRNYFSVINDGTVGINKFVEHENIDSLGFGYDHKNYQVPEIVKNDKNLTIVIVLANIGLSKSLNESLSSTYNCLTVNNRQNGYDLIIKNIPDIVISDFLVTNINGFELCEMIRKNSKICHIPIILLTEQNANDHIVAGFEKGADACIPKPVKIDILEAQISRLIKNRELIRKKYLTQNFMVEISYTNLKRDDEFIVRLRQLLEENLSDFDFNVHELSSRLDISNTTLYRKIKMITGLSPVEFMLLFKMQRAYDLLSTSASIKSIGYSLGFRHLSYFSSCFKKQFGVTPFVFREKGFKQIEIKSNSYYSKAK